MFQVLCPAVHCPYSSHPLSVRLLSVNTYKCKKAAVYTSVNGDVVGYTLKTAKIKRGDIIQQHIAECQCVDE